MIIKGFLYNTLLLLVNQLVVITYKIQRIHGNNDNGIYVTTIKV